MQGASKVLIGSSRHGALYHIVKGRFQTRLESVLPPDIPVEVLRPSEAPPPPANGNGHSDDAKRGLEEVVNPKT